MNLSGEIGLTKNRLTSLRADILAGKNDSETLHALDQAVSQLDLLVSDLQNSVMKTRMQPIGRLFQKYPRIARDLARQLGKDVELVLAGEETEVDKTMIEDLADPLIHLIRNAVDHGVEMPEERQAAGKSIKSLVRLEARQEGDHIVLIIADDGKGMSAERIRAKAIEKQNRAMAGAGGRTAVKLRIADYAARGGMEGAEVIMWLVMRGALTASVRKVHQTYYLPSMTGIATAIYENQTVEAPSAAALERHRARMGAELAGAGQLRGTYPFDLERSVKAYRLNRFLHSLIEPAQRQRFLANEEAAFTAAGVHHLA